MNAKEEANKEKNFTDGKGVLEFGIYFSWGSARFCNTLRKIL
jgi:hypothetical protein